MSDKQEAQAALAAAVKKIEEAVAEAEAIADQHGLTFSLDIAYGMGGTYIGENIEDEWYSSNAGSWMASSQSC